MTKKEMVTKATKATMTMVELKKALETLDFETKVSVSKNDPAIRNIYDASGKSKLGAVTIIEKPSKEVKKSNDSKHNIKRKGDSYIIIVEFSKKEGAIIKNDISTCAEVKVFLKKIRSPKIKEKYGKVVTVNIFQSDMTPTRFHAWKGEDVSSTVSIAIS